MSPDVSSNVVANADAAAEVPGPASGPGPGPRPLVITGLLLLDPHGNAPTSVESLTFDDDGIGVVRIHGQAPRVLPWDSVITHAVEPWAGGVIPEWWVEATPPRDEPSESLETDPVGRALAGTVTSSHLLPHADAGALISIQTRTGTYRFLRSGAQASELAPRITEFTIHHQGPSGVSTVTTVAAGRSLHGSASGRSTWSRVRPWLMVLMVVVIAAAVTAILLQSAGVIHLPYLGSSSSTAGPAVPLLSPL